MTPVTGALSVNLVPAARLRARRRRFHVMRCAAACCAYAAVAAAAASACRGVWGRADASLPGRLSDAAAAVERVTKDVAAAKADLDAASATLRASRSIAEQPDWSLLMQLLASKEGDEIVLRECRVLPRDPASAARWDAADAGRAERARESERAREAAKPGGKATAAPPPAAPAEPSMTLSVAGLGRSQPAVSQFVLRLEGLHLFAKVVLLDTNRETYLGGEAVGFRIECSLDDPAASSGSSAPTATSGGARR